MIREDIKKAVTSGDDPTKKPSAGKRDSNPGSEDENAVRVFSMLPRAIAPLSLRALAPPP